MFISAPDLVLVFLEAGTVDKPCELDVYCVREGVSISYVAYQHYSEKVLKHLEQSWQLKKKMFNLFPLNFKILKKIK